MMTSVVSNQARGTRDRTLPTTTQTTQPQKQIQVSQQGIVLLNYNVMFNLLFLLVPSIMFVYIKCIFTLLKVQCDLEGSVYMAGM